MTLTDVLVMYLSKAFQDAVFTDHISEGGNAIASIRLSVLSSVCFPYLRNRLTVDLERLHVSRSRPYVVALRGLKIKVIGQDQGHGPG